MWCHRLGLFLPFFHWNSWRNLISLCSWCSYSCWLFTLLRLAHYKGIADQNSILNTFWLFFFSLFFQGGKITEPFLQCIYDCCSLRNRNTCNVCKWFKWSRRNKSLTRQVVMLCKCCKLNLCYLLLYKEEAIEEICNVEWAVLSTEKSLLSLVKKSEIKSLLSLVEILTVLY